MLDCPISDNKNASQVMVVVHNPMTQKDSSILRILLPSSNYKVQMWRKEQKGFIDAQFDIIE